MMNSENQELPQNLKPIYQKGVFAFNKANYAYAVNLFMELLTLKPEHADARHYLRLSRWKLSEQAPPSLIKNLLNEISQSFHKLKVFFYQLKKEPFKELNEYEKALNYAPKNIGLLTKIGCALINSGMTSSAQKTFEDIITLDNTNLVALRHLGSFYMRKGDYDNARKCLQRALNISPSDYAVQKALNDLDAMTLLEKDFKI